MTIGTVFMYFAQNLPMLCLGRLIAGLGFGTECMACNVYLAEVSPIDLPTILLATKESLHRLDESFFRVRFDRLTPREKEYLHALAILGDGAQRSGSIAEKLNVKPQAVAPIRNNLIKKGMIYSPSYGDTDFTVPLFGDFMKRIMPVGPTLG